jgi:[ribosomal protein S5]-alanine N-acetyltransferase
MERSRGLRSARYRAQPLGVRGAHSRYAARVNHRTFEQFPAIETDRLQLRELLDDDAPALFEVFRDEEVTRYYDIDAMVAVASAAVFIANMRQRYGSGMGIRWALESKSERTLIGTIGFNSINQSAHRGMIGYELARKDWGRGLATEAVRAIVRFGHEQMGLNRIEAVVMLDNHASVRVLQKAGFSEEGVLRAFGYWKGSYHDLRMFSVLRDTHPS